MHNPLRSEADAFRWVVMIGAGAVAVIVLTLLTRPVFGAILAAALIGFGIGVAYRSSRGSLPRSVEVTRGGDGKHRLLVVANETVGGGELLNEIGERCRDRDCEVLVVTPALAGSRAAHWASEIDEAIEAARQRMELSLIALEELGVDAGGEVGDSDPNVAIAQEPAAAPPPTPNPGPNPNPPNPNPNPNPNPTPPCVVTLDSSERTFNPGGGEGSFRVTIAAGCRWSASSDANWVRILGSNDGTGSDTVRYRVDANINPSIRNATISVAGQTHRVRQDGAPAAPPGNGNGERVDLSGRAFFVDGSCPNLTFFLESRRVFTTDDTNFRGNCRAIRNRTRLSVDGRLQPDARVRATRVDIGDDDDN